MLAGMVRKFHDRGQHHAVGAVSHGHPLLLFGVEEHPPMGGLEPVVQLGPAWKPPLSSKVELCWRAAWLAEAVQCPEMHGRCTGSPYLVLLDAQVGKGTGYVPVGAGLAHALADHGEAGLELCWRLGCSVPRAPAAAVSAAPPVWPALPALGLLGCL